MTKTLDLDLTGSSPSEAYLKVSAAILERSDEAEGRLPKLDLSVLAPHDFPAFYIPPPSRFRHMTVSPWMFNHLRWGMSDLQLPLGEMFVDYMDGVGARPQIRGIVATPDRNQPQHVVRLGV